MILAGDHLQLPPTIKSKDDNKVLSYTLFDRMMSVYGDKVSRLLNTQYRMNEKIMNFSSEALYHSRLLAHESVKSHLISDLEKNKNSDNLNDNSNSNINLNLQASELTENDTLEICNKPLVLVDTSNYQFSETSDIDSGSKFNIGEAKICKFFVDYLKNLERFFSLGSRKAAETNGSSEDNTLALSHESIFIKIGVITPYSAQVNYLRNLMPAEEYPGLEISTVDGFQGREKEIIILDLVRSNIKHEVGFLADKRRLNVAVTRAKRMCLLVCDSSTVKNDSFIRKLCEYFEINAREIEINFNIFEHKEIEDIQLETSLLSDKNAKEKNILAKEEQIYRNLVNNKESDAADKKKLNKKNKKKKKNKEN